MMLEPTMSDLLKTISNRYLLVNIAAKRARDIADAAEMAEEPLEQSEPEEQDPETENEEE